MWHDGPSIQCIRGNLVSIVSLVLYYQNTRAEHCKLMTHGSKKVVTSGRGQKVRKDGHYLDTSLLSFCESRHTIALGLHVKMIFFPTFTVVPMDYRIKQTWKNDCMSETYQANEGVIM